MRATSLVWASLVCFVITLGLLVATRYVVFEEERSRGDADSSGPIRFSVTALLLSTGAAFAAGLSIGFGVGAFAKGDEPPPVQIKNVRPAPGKTPRPAPPPKGRDE